MNCEELALHLRLDCIPIQSRVGEEGLFVALESTFEDGEPLPMYVFKRQPKFFLTDGGDALFHLHKVGFRILGDSRRWSGIREAVNECGAALTASGEIELWAPENNLADAVNRYTAALLAVARWEVENFRKPLDATALADEVKAYLQYMRPDAVFTDDTKVMGISGREYTFPFSADASVIDVIGGSTQAINATIRKLFDIRALPSNSEQSIEVAIDDRTPSKTLEQDIRLIRELADPLPISKMVAVSSKAVLQ